MNISNLFLFGFILINYFAVHRVHWLRARAQLMRWQEEVTLTGYEMQWTVAFFVHNSKKWGKLSGSSAGRIAYASRKKAMWNHLAIRADRAFS